MNTPPPCEKDCPGRNSTCHAKCNKYSVWKAHREQLKEKARQEKDIDAALIEMARKWSR